MLFHNIIDGINTALKPLAVLLHGFPDVAANWSQVEQLLNARGIATRAPALPDYAQDKRALILFGVLSRGRAVDRAEQYSCRLNLAGKY